MRRIASGATTAAGRLALACVVSGISGFFDGQLGKPGLQPRCAFQWLLVAATLGISGLATARVVQLIRHR